MIEVTVQRGAGDRPAERIVEPLLAGSLAALTARAEAEADASFPDARTVDIEIVPNPAIKKGMIVAVHESGMAVRYALVHSLIIAERRPTTDAALERSMRLVVEYRIP